MITSSALKNGGGVRASGTIDCRDNFSVHLLWFSRPTQSGVIVKCEMYALQGWFSPIPHAETGFENVYS